MTDTHGRSADHFDYLENGEDDIGPHYGETDTSEEES